MATTPTPIVWDYKHSVGPASGVGGTIEYYDTEAQSIFLDAESPGGFQSRATVVEEGHWRDAEWTDIFNINHQGHQHFSLDHPANGIVFGANVTATQIWFWRYVYELDISEVIDSGSWDMQNDNGIASVSLSIMNGGSEDVDSDYTLFQPGARIHLAATLGDSDPYDIGIACIDEISWSPTEETFDISGRNLMGFLLNDSTCYTITEITGMCHEVVDALMEQAGVTDYDVTIGDHEWKYEFKPSDSILDALNQVKEMYPGFDIIETPTGKIVIGYANLRNQYVQTGTYSFSLGDDCFSRSMRKNIDAVYTKVYATGKDSQGNDLTPAVVDIPYWSVWHVPAHKIFYTSAPDGYNQANLQQFAEDVADELQYVGITEELTGPFRPQLLVGDVAQVSEDGNPVNLGVITSVTHHFGKQGFSTDFTVDSGGVNTSTNTRTKALGGFTRRQGLVDLIKVVSSKDSGGNGYNGGGGGQTYETWNGGDY